MPDIECIHLSRCAYTGPGRPARWLADRPHAMYSADSL
ncbi:hypothetical protein I546_4833 [Mycobacterium kansasii 732]|nr:hypothetical protein I546_4833 [Mycobacterium kansasii 732]